MNTTYAEQLVSMWQSFAQRRPYDRLGALLPGWIARLERLDMEDPGCWVWFIIGPALVDPASNLILGHTEDPGLEDGSSELPDASSEHTVDLSDLAARYDVENSK